MKYLYSTSAKLLKSIESTLNKSKSINIQDLEVKISIKELTDSIKYEYSILTKIKKNLMDIITDYILGSF